MIHLAHEPLLTMRPSFANGFARNETESAYPSLWRGLAGAWCPSLGIQGRKLIDMSNNGHDGIFSSGMGMDAWTPSPWGWALKYDGTDDLVAIGTSLFDMNTDFYFMMRVRVDDITHNAYTMLGASVASSGTSGYFLFLHRTDKGGFVFQYDTGPGTGQWCSSPSKAAVADQWYTLLLGRNKNYNSFILMQDDYVTALDTTNPTFVPSTGQTWCIGSWDSVTPSNCFKGQIGDVLCWNRGLSRQEQEYLCMGVAHPLMLRPQLIASQSYIRGSVAGSGSMMLTGVGN